MDSQLTVNNIAFYLNNKRDITSLLNQDLTSGGGASKRSSLDCKRLITTAFSPQIPISCSAEVDLLADKFGYHSFFQLIKPFGDRIHHKFQIKDSQLTSKTADDFSLRFTRPLSDLLTVQEAQSNKLQILSHQSLELLMDEYLQVVNPKLEEAEAEHESGLINLLRDSVYLKYFTKLLSSSSITPFEYINHPVASFLVFSAKESYDKARELLISFKATKLPEYLSLDDILPIFIVIYDEESEEEQKRAFQLKDQIKRQLFIDTFLLPLSFDLSKTSLHLNPPLLLSVDEELQDSHLSKSAPSFPTSNVTSIYKLLKEVIQKKIIPFMEQKIATWDDQVVAPRKSITGRLFNVSRKYFGNPVKNQNTAEHHNNYNPKEGYYRSHAGEALTRKLADWSFMLRDYRYAYTTYELAKKDFLSDKAWPHLASTQELAAISLLMGASNITTKLRSDTIDPLIDSANYTYLSRCGLKTYALRLVLIVSELFMTLRDGWSTSPAALKWVKKALDDKLVGKVGRCLLTERISYIYSLYVSDQAKIIISRKLLGDSSKEGEEKDQEHFHNPIKLPKKDMKTVGFTNVRKSALWSLLVAKDWDPALHPLQAHFSLIDARPAYDSLTIATRESSLFRKLNDATRVRQALHT